MGSDGIDNLSLDTIRKTLIGLEDTIIYSLIQRAKFPLNSPAYDSSSSFPGFHGSFIELFIKGNEAVQSQFGRYQSPEEVPFFRDHLPPPLVHRPQNCSQELPASAAAVTVNNNIWDFYVHQYLPLLAAKGDDGNYALSVSSDLVCLQDKGTLMDLLTDGKVEEMVKQRVEKKAKVYGQEVTLNDTNNIQNNDNNKIDPSLVSRLYDEWVIPFTKDVEVEYLLRRLDD
ncbi:Chorismate mutase 2 [Bienertia sinuspersici]